jgi:quinol monooxygenase YgiN
MVRLSIRLCPRRGETKRLTAAMRLVMAQTLGVRGCLGCDLSADLVNPDGLHYAEHWSTEVELRERIRSHQFLQFIAVLEVSAMPPRMDIEFVSSVRGLDYLADVLDDA